LPVEALLVALGTWVDATNIHIVGGLLVAAASHAPVELEVCLQDVRRRSVREKRRKKTQTGLVARRSSKGRSTSKHRSSREHVRQPPHRVARI
jgi:hypothetical protein